MLPGKQHPSYVCHLDIASLTSSENFHRQVAAGSLCREGERKYKKFWKELICLLSLRYLTVKYQLHCLPTVNYVHWFP
jgi:hypothetical protein